MLRPILLCAAGAAFLAGGAPAANLLGYYEFEGNYDDSSGNANHAAPVQNPTEVSVAGVTGISGGGADINDPAANGGGNTGGTIDIPISADKSANPEISFGGWVNLDSNAGFPGFMATDNGGWDRGIHLNTNVWGISSGGGSPTLSGIAPAPGSWEYVVGTFGGGTATLYVGDANAGTPTTATFSQGDNHADPGQGFIEIGRYDNQDFDGRVDDIFVFGSLLNLNEVNAIRNLRLSGLDFGVGQANSLFNLFDSSSSGNVGGLTWSPAGGLNGAPGEVIDHGDGTWSLVLNDGTGAGLTGVPEPTAPLLGALGLAALLFRRQGGSAKADQRIHFQSASPTGLALFVSDAVVASSGGRISLSSFQIDCKFQHPEFKRLQAGPNKASEGLAIGE